MTLNQYCLLLLSTKDFAHYCFASFAYWCEIKRMTTVGVWAWLRGLAKVDVLDVRHRQTQYPCDTVSLWRPTLFSFLAAVTLASSIISVVESERRGEKKWSLDWRSHHFLAKSSPGHKTRVKLSLLKLNLFLYIYLQTTQRKGKKGDGCTGEKTIHAEIYIFSHIKS